MPGKVRVRLSVSGDSAEEGESRDTEREHLSPNEVGLGLCSGLEEPADPRTPRGQKPKNPPFS